MWLALLRLATCKSLAAPEQITCDGAEEERGLAFVLKTAAHDDRRRGAGFRQVPVDNAMHPQTVDTLRHERHTHSRRDQPEGRLQLPHFVYGGRFERMIAQRRELLVRVTRARRTRIDNQRLAC